MAASSDSPDSGAHGASLPSGAAESPRAAEPAGPSAARPAPVRPSEPPQARPGAARPEPARRGRWAVWMLAIALVLALLWGFTQGRYAEQLAAEVASLEGELSQVGAERDALRAHLDRVREGVDDVAGRVLGLRELAHADPMAAAQVPPDGSPTTPDEPGSDAAEGAATDDLPAERPADPPTVVDF